MKNLLKFAILSLAVTALWSCDDKVYVDTGLQVNPNNISGTWQLAEWNGSPLTAGSFVYLDIVRKDKKYTIYQNIDSFATRIITGEYNIESHPEYGPVIRGLYDYDGGDWLHRYIVRDLTKDSMTWVALDDQNEIQVFKRCDKIPDNIVNGNRAVMSKKSIF